MSSGGSQTYTITPNSGYVVNTVTVDGTREGAITSYTFSSVSADHTISATFMARGLRSNNNVDSSLNTQQVPLFSLINVYPNPCAGAFNIIIPAAYTQATVTIADINGRIVTLKNITENDGTPIEFNLSNPASGVYLVKVNAGEANFTTKVIIE